VNGVPNGPASVGGLNNAGNDPSGAGNSAKSPNAPGTNSAGIANSSGSAGASAGAGGSGGAQGSTTVGRAGNSAGTTGGRIDGTVTKGPAMSGDAEIRGEEAKVDKKIKSICKGC